MFAFPTSRRRGDRPITRRSQIRRSRPLLEVLEGRQLLTAQAFDVLKTSDYNPATTSLTSSTAQNTLRWAILESELAGNAGCTIDFKIPGTGVQTITPLSTLPQITATVTIKGLTQAGASASKPTVVLNGTTATTAATKAKLAAPVGLELRASKSMIEALVVDDFGGGGIWLDTASGTTTGAVSGDTIADDFIGVNAAGTASASNGNFPLRLNDGANHNTITGCVVSGNSVTAPSSADTGIHVNDDSYDNVFAGNMIGTNSAGTAALANAGNGVIIDTGSYGNTVGGTTAASANVISGNVDDGVHIMESGVMTNVVEGNFIGTDITGTKPLGNGDYGVEVQQSNSNTIGGSTSGARNIISANGLGGVDLDSGTTTVGLLSLVVGSNDNVIQGNYIGTDKTGTKILDPTGTKTLGNAGDGVAIESNSNSNVVEGRQIGTDLTGENPLGNVEIGVAIDSSYANKVGGTVSGTALGAGNVISGNGSIGVKLTDVTSNGQNNDNAVEGNYIGTDVKGSTAIENHNNGVVIDYGSNGNTIGGPTAAYRNVISGNVDSGVVLTTGATGQPVSSNLLEDNLIGTNLGGTARVPNGNDGVDIEGSSKNSIVGNTISGNGDDGVYITDSVYFTTNSKGQQVTNLFDSSNNVLTGNTIGGSKALGNASYGVAIDLYSTGNTNGGTTASAGNTIYGNGASGVYLTNSVGVNNVIDHDVIESNGGSGVYL
jgi:large repetitive protein